MEVEMGTVKMHCQYLPHGHFATCVVGEGFVFPYIKANCQKSSRPTATLKTNGERNLKMLPLEKEKHLQKPPTFKVPAVSFWAYTQPAPLRFFPYEILEAIILHANHNDPKNSKKTHVPWPSL